MPYQLNDEQISELFAFCKRHYVHHYDVQVELVDHLANAIEERISADTSLTFEKTLEEVHKGFGYKGFAGVVAAKANALNKQHSKLKWRLFRSYFTWPKAALIIMMIAILLFLKQILPADYLVWLITTLSVAFVIFEIVIKTRSHRLFKKQKEKLLLTETRGNQLFSSFIGFQIIVNCIKFEQATIVTWQYISFGTLLVLMIISTLSYYNMCKQLKEVSLKEYPKAYA